MTSPEYLALAWTERFIALAVAFQSLELLQLRATYTENGIWRWSILAKEFASYPRPLQWLFAQLLRYPNFLFLLVAQVVAAIAIGFTPYATVAWFLLFTTILIAVRWRGTFNGGSDYMTMIVLLAVAIARTFPERPDVTFGCLWYIALQVCSSYFISGVAKFRRESWRTGRALPIFFESSIYAADSLGKFLTLRPALSRAASWVIILFECIFPLALLNPTLCTGLIALALLFHLVNFYVFGLNRFLFAWLSAYPALYYSSHFLSI